MAMKMKSMKIDEAARKARYKENAAGIEGPSYPYGLCLHLDAESMEALGLTELPEAGKPVMIHAKADVTNVGVDERAGPDGKVTKQKTMSLQITDLAIGPMEEEKADAGAALYKA